MLLRDSEDEAIPHADIGILSRTEVKSRPCTKTGRSQMTSVYYLKGTVNQRMVAGMVYKAEC